MEDLAYIYLALNDEIERNKEFNEDSLSNSYSIWAPPIVTELDCDRAIAFAEPPTDFGLSSSSAIGPVDEADSTFQPYQGFFYL